MNLNRATLIGRVTRTPELKTTPNGLEVVKLGLATNHTYKDADGVKQEKVQFHNLVAFGKTAAAIAQYVVKGQEMYFDGRIEYREWTDKEGNKRNSTEIMVEQFQFGQKATPKGESAPAKVTNNAPVSEDDAARKSLEEGDESEIRVEDIPF